METLRVHYKKVIQSEIRQLMRFREMAMKRSSQDNIERFDAKIAALEEELEAKETPRFELFVKEQQAMIRLQEKNSHAKTDEIQQNHDNRVKLEAYHKEENRLRRKERSQQYQMKRDWEWLCAQDAKLPDYIRENLTKMPNNKGYIWRGIWYFGRRPAEDPNLLIMFERSNGETLIHEILYGKYRKVYRKNKNGSKDVLREVYF